MYLAVARHNTAYLHPFDVENDVFSFQSKPKTIKIEYSQNENIGANVEIVRKKTKGSIDLQRKVSKSNTFSNRSDFSQTKVSPVNCRSKTLLLAEYPSLCKDKDRLAYLVDDFTLRTIEESLLELLEEEIP